MTQLTEALARARSEEDVKDAYVRALGLNPPNLIRFGLKMELVLDVAKKHRYSKNDWRTFGAPVRSPSRSGAR